MRLETGSHQQTFEIAQATMTDIADIFHQILPRADAASDSAAEGQVSNGQAYAVTFGM
jgi:hypothetical protein